MSDRAEPERYTVSVVALPGDVPAVIRVRRLLKAMRRGYGLRCVEVRPDSRDPADTSAGGTRCRGN